MGQKRRRDKSRTRSLHIPLSDIVLSEKNRSALQRDSGQIERMRRDIECGKRMQPIVLQARPEGGFTVTDGRHRFLAAELAGSAVIEAIIKG